MQITIPYKFSPRSYQIPLFKAMDGGIDRAVCVWHRRAGKDASLINLMTKKAFERVGSYYYFFPEFNQGRRVIWDGINRDGFRFMDHIPHEIRESTNNQEMKIKLKNGSVFQIVGTDNYHMVRGTNPVGCVFSEYSLQNPKAWDVISPILSENGGWAVFNFTPLGRNHGYEIYTMAKHNPKWFCQVLTVDDTFKEDGTPVISKQAIQDERLRGMTEDMIQQEYFCLSPETRVLTANLQWVPIRSLLENKVDLVGIDENPKVATGRKMRRSKVEKAWETIKECVEIHFTDGSSVISSLEHPWLIKQKADWKNGILTYEWVDTEKLHVGMQIASCGLEPWEYDTSYNAGYLAGLYDGEGCLSRRTAQFAQKNGVVLDSVRSALKKSGFSTFETSSGVCVSISMGLHNTMRFLGSIRPKRLLENADSIWDGAFPFNGAIPKTIERIKNIGDRTVIGISTSTKTFIAEGLVTHNCSFDAAIQGSYYSDCINAARAEGRIMPIEIDPVIPIDTVWDLGRNDDNSVWFIQRKGRMFHVIDFDQRNGESLKTHVGILHEKGYKYGTHYLPHDIAVTDYSAEASRINIFMSTYSDLFHKEPDIEKMKASDPMDRVAAVRARFPQFIFNESSERVRFGLDCLTQYRKDYDEKNRVFRLHPKHDFASHAADAFGYFALNVRDTVPIQKPMASRRFTIDPYAI